MPRRVDDSDESEMSDVSFDDASDASMSSASEASAMSVEPEPIAKKTAAKKKTGASNTNTTGKTSNATGKTSNTVAKSSKAEARRISVGGGKKKTVEEIYQKKTQLEHILLRPDTYIGSVEANKQPMWVWDAHRARMVHRDVLIVPGFYKIFDEILVNAADNKQRDPNMNTMRVVIDRENNSISVYNNGRGIPIEMHQKEKLYVPELIFGHLLTSSNYNDEEKKVTGGRNGYGAKLCNIFSKQFIVETADKISGKKFKQVFSNNMSSRTEPQITTNARGEEYTRITFKPDLEKFGMTSIDDDHDALLKKRVYDIAGCLRNVKVYLNDERINVRNFRHYVDLYLTDRQDSINPEKPHAVIHEIVNDRWEIAFTLSDGQFQHVSFVNSISTSKGGTHVNAVADAITSKLLENIQKKNKGAPVKQFQIKNHMWIYVNCLVENPSFDSQTKENMTLKASAFGSKCEITDEFLNKVKKSGLIESVLRWAKFKQDQLLKKTDGSKRSRISGITKLDDANNAGTRQAQNCTLILTEGDSAKTLAVTGLGVVGRDNFGVFPLRGKLLNVREASHKQIMENQEINNIKQILGLQHGKKYSDTASLRYGHLMIMTDQDHDGSHIKGLIINFLDHFWPDLLKVPGFLCEFITPIVKVSRGGEGRRREEISFYTLPEYENWKEENNNGKGWTIKYYKGLGTSTKEDARKYFQGIDHHRKIFSELQQDERDLIDMAFNKKKADNRKEWLRQFRPGTFMDHSQHIIPISDFINKELILFSMADNCRSLPHVVDGLKPGLRKILFACFKRNLNKGEIKVAQLSGYVAEHSAYHHGEQSLQASIIGMAQNFVGSNNINLLEPRGQFGSRLQGGKDAASARYIFTRLSNLARTIYHKADDALLSYLDDDGQLIEPEWYMPILPMVLVNGGEGIGTGWSSFIPNYNPSEIVENLKRLMRAEDGLVKMTPWYRGFKGAIVEQGDKFVVSGTINKIDDTTLEITELPIRTWTQSYKEFLESMLTGTEKVQPFIKDYKEYHTDTKVHFVVSLTEQNMKKAEAEGLDKKFKMTTTISTSNMVCFDHEGRIRKYNNVEEILRDFYHLRLAYYQKRKDHLVNQLTEDWERLDNKVRFVTEIITNKLIVHNRKKADIVDEMSRKGYKPFSKDPKKETDENQEEASTSSGITGYDYLLSMPIWNLTSEKVENLRNERDSKQAELDDLLATSVRELWTRDLDAFLDEWEKFQADMDEIENMAPGQMKKGAKKLGKVKKFIKPKKKLADSDEDESDDASLDDESEDDFELTVKKSRPKKQAAAAPPPKPAPITKAAPANKQQTTLDSFLHANKKTAPSKPTAPSYTSIIHANSDDDDEEAVSLAEAIARRKQTIQTMTRPRSPTEDEDELLSSPHKKQKSPVVVSISDDEMDGLSDQVDNKLHFGIKAKAKPVVKKAVVAKPKKIIDSSDEDDEIKPVPKKAPAKKAVPKPKPLAKAVKKKVSSDEDVMSEDDDFVPVSRQPVARRARPAPKYVEVVSDSDEKSEESGSFEESDDFEGSDDE